MRCRAKALTHARPRLWHAPRHFNKHAHTSCTAPHHASNGFSIRALLTRTVYSAPPAIMPIDLAYARQLQWQFPPLDAYSFCPGLRIHTNVEIIQTLMASSIERPKIVIHLF
jgi:hypothetical protein